MCVDLCLTVGVHLPPSQNHSQSSGERQPLLLDDGGPNNEQGRGDVYALDILGCEEARHGDERSVCAAAGGLAVFMCVESSQLRAPSEYKRRRPVAHASAIAVLKKRPIGPPSVIAADWCT